MKNRTKIIRMERLEVYAFCMQTFFGQALPNRNLTDTSLPCGQGKLPPQRTKNEFYVLRGQVLENETVCVTKTCRGFLTIKSDAFIP